MAGSLRMPLGDMFAPDINFTTAKAVYPGARGGTSASAAGAMTGSTSVGTANDGSAGATPGTPLTTSGKSLGWWLGLFALLGVMVYAARKAGNAEDFHNIRPTLYNFLAITLTAIVGIVGLKVIFAKYRIAGISDVILAT